MRINDGCYFFISATVVWHVILLLENNHKEICCWCCFYTECLHIGKKITKDMSLISQFFQVVFSFCQQVSKQIVFFFFVFVFFFWGFFEVFFFLSLSLSIPHSPFSLSLFPFLLTFPTTFFFISFYFFLLLSSLSLVFSVPWSCLHSVVSKWYIKLIKLINIKKKKEKKEKKIIIKNIYI